MFHHIIEKVFECGWIVHLRQLCIEAGPASFIEPARLALLSADILCSFNCLALSEDVLLPRALTLVDCLSPLASESSCPFSAAELFPEAVSSCMTAAILSLALAADLRFPNRFDRPAVFLLELSDDSF